MKVILYYLVTTQKYIQLKSRDFTLKNNIILIYEIRSHQT